MQKKATVKIELMESQRAIGRKRYRALAINDRRYGPDAGPWTVIDEFRVNAQELMAVATQAIDDHRLNTESLLELAKSLEGKTVIFAGEEQDVETFVASGHTEEGYVELDSRPHELFHPTLFAVREANDDAR